MIGPDRGWERGIIYRAYPRPLQYGAGDLPSLTLRVDYFRDLDAL